MTEKELGQYRALCGEIDDLRRRRRELMDRATATTAILTGMPHGGGTSDRVGESGAHLAWLAIHLDAQIALRDSEQQRLYEYIAGVEDGTMRKIMRLRFIDGKSWQAVAFDIGEHDESYPRQMLKRYMQLTENTE